ncbi:MAG: M28 family peptidase [Bacteroidales bacterium]|nr:M28 family peptidase [Bacteroidales bacterium]
MRKFFTAILLLWLSWITLPAQTISPAVASPSQNNFTAIISFLSSDWMEGREAASRGGFMAADYIASMMQVNGLAPYGDGSIQPRSSLSGAQSYFQNFELVRTQVQKASLAVVRPFTEGESTLQFNLGTDFEITPVLFGGEAEATVVFAGYGIEAPGKGYNDYQGTDVNDRIVIVISGYPGHADTTSPAGKKLRKTFGETYSSLEKKLRVAEKHGAIAVIVVNVAMNTPKPTGPDYEDPEYFLPGDTSTVNIPCFRLSHDATRLLFKGTEIDLTGFEKNVARDLVPASRVVHGKKLRFSVAVKSENVMVRNVLGVIPGSDTTRNLIVGAHYDHLGMRKALIYNGADDNASGVAGMLALSKAWAAYPEKPSCNIIFAAWTAEEKGILGSTYFAIHSPIVPERLSLVINMDMISRSAPEDSTGKQISIGTLPVNEDLRKMAKTINSHQKCPFLLDLWDVTGHSGSDYGSFAARKIPVMTFFSGFHDDYHSPRDIAAKTNPVKMEAILKIVNECIREASVNPPVK